MVLEKLIKKVLSERDYAAIRTQYSHSLRLIFTFRQLLARGPYNGKSLVDLGCSEGTYSIIFDKIGFTVTAVDIIEKDLERLRYLKKKYNSNCRILNASMESDDFLPGEKFDYVFCSEVIEHLDNPQKAITNIKKISHENTQIIISMPNVVSPWGAIKLIHELLKYRFKYSKVDVHRKWPFWKIINLLKSGGLNPRVVGSVNFSPFNSLGINTNLSQTFPFKYLGYSIFLICKIEVRPKNSE